MCVEKKRILAISFFKTIQLMSTYIDAAPVIAIILL